MRWLIGFLGAIGVMGLAASPMALAQVNVSGLTQTRWNGFALAPYSSGDCPSSGSFVAGSTVFTNDGDLCYAPAAGAPPTWVTFATSAALQAHLDDTEAAHAATAISYDDTSTELGTTTTQGAIEAVLAAAGETQAQLDALTAADIPIVDTGALYDAAEAEAAFAEVMGDTNTAQAAADAAQADATQALSDAAGAQADIDGHIADTEAAHAGSAISVVGGAFVHLSALIDDVQELAGAVDAALDALDSAVTAAQGDATQALADAAAAQATADAAAVAATLASTDPGEGASTVGLEAIAGLVATTVQAGIAEVKGLADAAQAAADAAQADATQALAAAAAAQATADAAIPQSLADAAGDYLRASADDTWARRTTAETQGDLDVLTLTTAAVATPASEGAALVGSSQTGTGYGDGATVEARLDDLAGDLGTVATTAGGAIAASLATDVGQYLRSTAAGAWAVRTTVETQGDLDVASLTALALATGGGLVGSSDLGTGWAAGSTVEARLDDASADLATVEGIASGAIPKSVFTTANTWLKSTGSATYVAENLATTMASLGLDTVHLYPEGATDAPDGSSNNVDQDRYCDSGECFFVITSNDSAQDGRRCWPVDVPAWATGVTGVSLRYKVANSGTLTLHLFDTDDTTPCDSNDSGTSTSYATLSTSTYASCTTWTAGSAAKLCAQCSGDATAACYVTGGTIQWQ